MELGKELEEIKEVCKPYYDDVDSVIHDWSHVHRVAKGAPLFVDHLGGTEEEKKLSYVAGILHDVVRPNTEEIDHAEASSEKAVEILSESSELSEDDIQRVSRAILDHRKPVDWVSPLHQSVYLADKIFEHMGAYLDFRATVWVGELSHTDYKGYDPIEAVLDYYREASHKFLEMEFPNSLEELTSYQIKWNKDYKEALQGEEKWAIEMANRLFEHGREKKNFKKTLEEFQVNCEKQGKWKKEMKKYLGFRTSEKPFSLIAVANE